MPGRSPGLHAVNADRFCSTDVCRRHGGRTMTVNPSRRWVVRTLCVAALLGAVPSLHAQYGYYQQPIQQMQNAYYGNYQNNTVPGYIYPRTYAPPNYPSYYGDGVN